MLFMYKFIGVLLAVACQIAVSKLISFKALVTSTMRSFGNSDGHAR